MTYADTLLADGETIVLHTRQHPLAMIKDARTGLLLWMLAVALVLAVPFLNITRPVSDYIAYAAIACLIVGLIIVLWHYLLWWTEEYIVTNRRLMKVNGVVNKRSGDSSLEKINDAILTQRFWGRVFNYGDLDILTASDQTVDSFRMLNKPRDFKRLMLNQKHALEIEYSRGPAPLPPLRAGPVDMNGRPTLGAPALAGESPTAPPTAAAVPPASTATALADSMPSPVATMPAGSAPATHVAAEPAEASAIPSPGPLPPPLPAAGPAESGMGGTSQTTTPASPTAEPSGRPDSAAVEITQTLARLADLRDRGAISEEDYQAKKAQLLDRL